MGKEQSMIMHPALSWIPFGFLKINNILQSWVHQTSLASSAWSPASQNSAWQAAFLLCPLLTQLTLHPQEQALHGESPCCLSVPCSFCPRGFGQEWGSTPPRPSWQAMMTCRYLAVWRKTKATCFIFFPIVWQLALFPSLLWPPQKHTPLIPDAPTGGWALMGSGGTRPSLDTCKRPTETRGANLFVNGVNWSKSFTSLFSQLGSDHCLSLSYLIWQLTFWRLVVISH